jgi:hypothetical protein
MTRRVPTGRAAVILCLALLASACGGDADTNPDVAPQSDAPAAAPAPAAGGGSARQISDRELQDYRLDMDRVRSWHQVILAGARRPDLQLQGDEDEEFDFRTESANRLLQRMESHPEIAQMTRQSGMQPRDFVITMYAVGRGIYGSAVARAGQSIDDIGTNQHNIDFVRQNEAELQRMQQEQAEAHRGNEQ